jgi:hypothetical protein
MKTLYCTVAILVCGIAQPIWACGHRGGRVGVDRRICIVVPQRPETLTIHFERTRGVQDFTGFPDLNLDAKQLTAEEVRQLRRWIADAGFFKLSDSKQQSPVVPDPEAGYILNIELDGRRHSVWITDRDVSKELQPMIQWLTNRAKHAIKISLTKSGGRAGLGWTENLDSTSLSDEGARELRNLIADSHFFELPNELNELRGFDLFEYIISIEIDGKRHTVQAYDPLPENLQPLLKWLSTHAGQARRTDR